VRQLTPAADEAFASVRGLKHYQSMRRLHRTQRRVWLIHQPGTWQGRPPVSEYTKVWRCHRATIYRDLRWVFDVWVPEQEAARQRRRRGGLASAAKRRAA
jgi:hypothetical protein